MRYVLLVNWPESGIDEAKRSRGVLNIASKAFKEVGGRFETIVHCVGDIDLVAIVEAPTAAAMTAFSIALESVGSGRTVVLQAYTPEELSKIIDDADAIRDGYIRSGGEEMR